MPIKLSFDSRKWFYIFWYMTFRFWNGIVLYFRILLTKSELETPLEDNPDDKNKTYLNVLKCPECGLIKKTNNALKKHLFVHKSFNEVRTFKCQYCTYVTKYNHKLKRHAVVHLNINEVQSYNCVECSFITKNK